MSALDRLKNLLDRGSEKALAREWHVDCSIDGHINKLERYQREGMAMPEQDIQEEAIRRFWTNRRLYSLREARLVSYGLALPVGPKRLRIIEDQERFPALLEGVEQYLPRPRQYRRCYQGLLSGYFGYDPEAAETPDTGRKNWRHLRSYLGSHSAQVLDGARNPQWAESLQRHPKLFGEEPCEPYGPALLAGNRTEVDELRDVLRISDSSWFMRKLLLAQIQAAIKKPDSAFQGLLPSLLELLRGNQIIHDQGLALVLDRYANMEPMALHNDLRDTAVKGWGNPWLDRNQPRWGRVGQNARAMVADWLKLEFIEAFFTVLAEERTGDSRRLEFWKRYVSAIDDMHFALGPDARTNRSHDFVILRKKMEGRLVELRDTVRTNNAFIMSMGSVVIVEFSGYSNACYVYDTPLPFHLDQPVSMPVDARNSLKNSQNIFRFRHQDGVGGYDTWEGRLESILVGLDGIHSDGVNAAIRAVTQVTRGPIADWSAVGFSRRALDQFAATLGIEIKDLTSRNGNLWVLVDDADLKINETLLRWNFGYKSDKGWWWKGT